MDFSDSVIAGAHIELQPDGNGMTNAATLLVRAEQLHADESGEHPGERFAMPTVTRAELVGLLELLEDDWADHCRYADPMADAAPLMTRQVRQRGEVLASLLDQAAEVIDTIEPESTEEADALRALLEHMRTAAADWRQAHGTTPDKCPQAMNY